MNNRILVFRLKMNISVIETPANSNGKTKWTCKTKCLSSGGVFFFLPFNRSIYHNCISFQESFQWNGFRLFFFFYFIRIEGFCSPLKVCFDPDINVGMRKVLQFVSHRLRMIWMKLKWGKIHKFGTKTTKKWMNVKWNGRGKWAQNKINHFPSSVNDSIRYF